MKLSQRLLNEEFEDSTTPLSPKDFYSLYALEASPSASTRELLDFYSEIVYEKLYHRMLAGICARAVWALEPRTLHRVLRANLPGKPTADDVDAYLEDGTCQMWFALNNQVLLRTLREVHRNWGDGGPWTSRTWKMVVEALLALPPATTTRGRILGIDRMLGWVHHGGMVMTAVFPGSTWMERVLNLRARADLATLVANSHPEVKEAMQSISLGSPRAFTIIDDVEVALSRMAQHHGITNIAVENGVVNFDHGGKSYYITYNQKRLAIYDSSGKAVVPVTDIKDSITQCLVNMLKVFLHKRPATGRKV